MHLWNILGPIVFLRVWDHLQIEDYMEGHFQNPIKIHTFFLRCILPCSHVDSPGILWAKACGPLAHVMWHVQLKQTCTFMQDIMARKIKSWCQNVIKSKQDSVGHVVITSHSVCWRVTLRKGHFPTHPSYIYSALFISRRQLRKLQWTSIVHALCIWKDMPFVLNQGEPLKQRTYSSPTSPEICLEGVFLEGKPPCAIGGWGWG